MLNPKFILKEEILSFLSESKQFNKSRVFLLENSESFSDDAFNDNFKKLFLEAIDHKSFYNDNPDVEDNLRQVAIEFQKIAPELSKKYQQFVNNSIKDPLNRSKKTIWDYKNFIDSWQDNEAFGKALHLAARKINPDSFGTSKEQVPQTQQQNTQQKFPSGRLVQHIAERINERFPGEEFGDYLVKETQRLFPSKPLVQKFFETFADQLKKWKNDEGERFNLEEWVVGVSEEIQDFGEDFDFYQYFPELSKNSSTNQKPLTDDEKIISKFLKAVGMKEFIQKWIEKNDEALSEPDKEKILEYCEEELFPDRFLSESKVIKISKKRLAQIIKKEIK